MKKQSPKPSFTIFGAKINRPAFADTISAALLATLGFLLMSWVMPPSSGAEAASRWCSFFITTLLIKVDFHPMSGLRSIAVWLLAVTVGSSLGMAGYVFLSAVVGA